MDSQQLADLYVVAARQGYRFETSRGVLTTEDLWQTPLTSRNDLNLDTIARTIHNQLREADGDTSFVNKNANTQNSAKMVMLKNKLEIVKHVIQTLQHEQELRQNQEATRAEIKRVEAALAARQDAALNNATEAELETRLAALRAGAGQTA